MFSQDLYTGGNCFHSTKEVLSTFPNVPINEIKKTLISNSQNLTMLFVVSRNRFKRTRKTFYE